jgi:hypothetical protein
MPIDDKNMARLVDLGRRNGNRLSVEQLGEVLPVDSLSPGEIATVVEKLEAAGIDVDLDEEWLKTRRAPDYERGAGVVSIADYAAPAVSAPGAVPSRHGWADDAGEHTGQAHGEAHGSRRAPTWDRNGVDLLPIAAIACVALVLIIALAP